MYRTCNRETGIETGNSLIWLLTINQKISRKAENSDFKIRLISCGLILLKSRKWYVFKKPPKKKMGVEWLQIYVVLWEFILTEFICADVLLWWENCCNYGGEGINIWSSCLYQRNRLVESLTHNYAGFFF